MKSATHSLSGPVAVKSLFTRSGALVWEASAWVVKRALAREAPLMACRAMRRATWSRPTFIPARRAALVSLRRP